MAHAPAGDDPSCKTDKHIGRVPRRSSDCRPAIGPIKTEGENLVLAYAHVRVGAHACRQFLASDVGDDEGVGSRRLNNLHLGIERRHAPRVAVEAFAVVHSLELT